MKSAQVAPSGRVTRVRIANADKLKVVRELDPEHVWPSLEERRYCVCCARIFTAKKVVIVASKPGNTRRLQCPTPGCDATPASWAVLTGSDTAVGVSILTPDTKQELAVSHNGRAVSIRRPSSHLVKRRAAVTSTSVRRISWRSRQMRKLARGMHRLAADYRSLIAMVQPARRSMFTPAP